MGDPAGELGQWGPGQRPVRPLAIRRIEPLPGSTDAVDVEAPNRGHGAKVTKACLIRILLHF